MATRKASGATLDALAAVIPDLVGGSADLTPSNNTLAEGMENIEANTPGRRYVHYSVREFGMSAVLNGLDGRASGLDRFGESAPGAEGYASLGFTP